MARRPTSRQARYRDWQDKPAKLAQKDRDARWTVKYSKAKQKADGSKHTIDIAIPAFGYKGHISIDREHGLIRKWKASDASRYDGAQLPDLMDKTIIVEVVDSHGCNSQHEVGDKLYFDGAGNLLTKLCPKKVCIYALNAATGLIFTANELVYAGVDPNEMRFKRAGCFDVGVECGGWGRVVLEIKVVDRHEA